MSIEASRASWNSQASRYLNIAAAMKGMLKRVLYILLFLIAAIMSANLILHTT